jgi:hypothetical protein
MLRGHLLLSPYLFENYGGLEKTRTSDLFRVKEAKSITYRWSSMKTRDLHLSDLDLKWTPEAVSGRFGPQVDLFRAHDPQHVPW